MPDLSSIQMMLDEGPAFLAEYRAKMSMLADQNNLLTLGKDTLSASETIMLQTWIDNNNAWLQDNLEKYQKLEGLSKLTEEQLLSIKKECEELCQMPSP